MEFKDDFYAVVEDQRDKLCSCDVKIILGDQNAKVGKEEIYKNLIGNHILHEISNDNGRRLVEFAPGREMIISGK